MINKELRKLITAKEVFIFFKCKYSESYIFKVLDKNNTRKNEEIEAAAEFLAREKLASIN